MSDDQPTPETDERNGEDAPAMELSEINPLPRDTPQFAYWNATHRQTYRPLWHMDIVPLPEMPLFLYPMSIGVQETNDPRYRAEGRLRGIQDYCYFCYTLTGTGGFSDKHGIHDIPEGGAFLTEIADPDTSYFYPGIDRRRWEFLAVNFRGLAARAMVRELVANYGSVYQLSPQSPIIKRLLGFQASDYTTIHPHALDGAEIVLELLLALAASARAREEPDPAMDLIKTALEIIDSDLEMDLNVGTLARRMGVNREYLSRAFQKCLQRSPKEILLEMKIRRASFLLKDTDTSIKQIAARLGIFGLHQFHPRLPPGDEDDSQRVPSARQHSPCLSRSGGGMGRSKTLRHSVMKKTLHSSEIHPASNDSMLSESIWGSRATLPIRVGVGLLTAAMVAGSIQISARVYDSSIDAFGMLLSAGIGAHAFYLATAREHLRRKRRGVLGHPFTRNIRFAFGAAAFALTSAPLAWSQLVAHHSVAIALYSLPTCLGLYIYYAATMTDMVPERDNSLTGDPITLRPRLQRTAILLGVYSLYALYAAAGHHAVSGAIVGAAAGSLYYLFYKTAH